VTDLEGSIVECNGMAAQIHGFSSREEMIGISGYSLVPDRERERVNQYYIETIKKGTLNNCEIIMLKKDGTEFPVEISATLLMGPGESPEFFVSVEIDKTDKKKQERYNMWQFSLKSSLAELYMPIVSSNISLREISALILDHARSITESKHGFAGIVDRASGDLVFYTLTDMMEDECTLSGEDSRIIFYRNADGTYNGLWGHALNTMKPFMANDPAGHPSSGGYPRGHISIERFLSVPVILEDALVGQIAVANPPGDYGDLDVEALQWLGEYFSLAIKRHYDEQKLRESEERSRLAQKASNIVIWDCDISSGILKWSDNIKEIIGLEPSERAWTYRDLIELIYPEERQLVLGKINDSMDHGAAYYVEHRIIRPDGQVMWAANSGDVFFNEKNEPVRMLGAIWNITGARKEQERTRQLSVAVEQNPVTIVITDSASKILYVNPKFTEISGYTPDEVIGRSTRIMRSGEHSMDFYQDLWSTIRSGNVWEGEFHNRKKNGDLYWEKSVIAPIKDENGDITHFVAIKEDISDKKALEQRLLDSTIEAEKANRAKSEFLANMSHELRTPLNAILGFSQILEMQSVDTLSDKHREYLKYIRDSGNHLLEMVNDILDLSKIEAGKIEINRKPFDCGMMLKRSPSTVKSLAHQKELHLDIDISPDIGYLNGDEVRLKQVIFNLLSNAIKFTPPGKNIGIRGYGDGDWVVITVWDEGIGVPELFY